MRRPDLSLQRMWCYNGVIMDLRSLRIVIDTNVLFEGLTQKNRASSLIVEAWLAGELRGAVCEALALEYVDVLSRKLSPQRWQMIQPLLRALLERAQFVPIYYTWRPSSPDPADDHVVDCVLNASALLITWNTADFRRASQASHLNMLTPPEFVAWWSAMETISPEKAT